MIFSGGFVCEGIVGWTSRPWANANAKRMDVEARRLDAESKIQAEDTSIMLTDLATMDDDTRPGC
jgi:hypothetical protein